MNGDVAENSSKIDKMRAEIEHEAKEILKDSSENLIKTFKELTKSLSVPIEEMGFLNLHNTIKCMDAILRMIKFMTEK